MRTMKQRFAWSFLMATAVVLLASACAEDDSPATAPATGSPTGATGIVCSTAYRVSSSEPLTEVDTVRFETDDSVQSIPYIYLEFHAEYTSGAAGDERALRLWVTPTAEEDVIVTQLFQLPQDATLVNQFAGEHGFTGLTYAYDPVSGAELQYWCEAS